MARFGRGGTVAEPESLDLVTAPVPDAAAFPRVNLMPEVIAAESRTRRAKKVLIGAAACALLAVGGLYVMATNDVNAAQEQVDLATAQGIQLKNELAKYQDVPKVQAEVQLAEAQAYAAMGGEVRFSFLLNNLALTMPRNVALTTLTASIDGLAPAAAEAGAQDGQAANVSALGNSGIGTIAYAGEARRYADVAAFLDSQAKQKTLLDPFPGTVQVAEAGADGSTAKGLTFDSSVTLTDAALSHRYDIKAGD